MSTAKVSPKYLNYVGGDWVDSEKHDEVRLPYDSTPVAEVPRADREMLWGREAEWNGSRRAGDEVDLLEGLGA